MTREDNRTEAQRATHTWAVVARDNFMSGWGGAKGGHSRCAWACASLRQAEIMEKWVRDREEMRYVSLVDLRSYRVPRGTAHFHIYVADTATHPALRRYEEVEA